MHSSRGLESSFLRYVSTDTSLPPKRTYSPCGSCGLDPVACKLYTPLSMEHEDVSRRVRRNDRSVRPPLLVTEAQCRNQNTERTDVTNTSLLASFPSSTGSFVGSLIPSLLVSLSHPFPRPPVHNDSLHLRLHRPHPRQPHLGPLRQGSILFLSPSPSSNLSPTRNHEDHNFTHTHTPQPHLSGTLAS